MDLNKGWIFLSGLLIQGIFLVSLLLAEIISLKIKRVIFYKKFKGGFTKHKIGQELGTILKIMFRRKNPDKLSFNHYLKLLALWTLPFFIIYLLPIPLFKFVRLTTEGTQISSFEKYSVIWILIVLANYGLIEGFLKRPETTQCKDIIGLRLNKQSVLLCLLEILSFLPLAYFYSSLNISDYIVRYQENRAFFWGIPIAATLFFISICLRSNLNEQQTRNNIFEFGTSNTLSEEKIERVVNRISSKLLLFCLCFIFTVCFLGGVSYQTQGDSAGRMLLVSLIMLLKATFVYILVDFLKNSIPKYDHQTVIKFIRNVLVPAGLLNVFLILLLMRTTV